MTIQDKCEKWRPVVGFEGRYEVSSLGNVRSLEWTTVDSLGRSRFYSGKRRSVAARDSSGYVPIGLSKERGYLQTRVHILVAEAFLGSRPSATHEVNHKDGVKHNNRASNLEWVTPSENSRHAYAMGLAVASPSVGEKHGSAKLDESQVRNIRSRRNDGAKLSELSREYGVAESTISAIARGRLWSHIQ